MGQIPWDMPAILVPPDSDTNFNGTLAACVRHWRDDMKHSQRAKAMVAMAAGRWLDSKELLRLCALMSD
jgi:hypothetical protein